MEEITVLDYLKFKLDPRNWGKELLPDAAEESAGDEVEFLSGAAEQKPFWTEKVFSAIQREGSLIPSGLSPYLAFLGTFAAIAAQLFLEPLIVQTSGRNPYLAGALYFLSACALTAAYLCSRRSKADGTGETDAKIEKLSTDESEQTVYNFSFSESVRYDFLAGSMVCLLLAFVLFGGNRFTFLNITFWLFALILGTAAFAESAEEDENPFIRLVARLRSFPAFARAYIHGFSLSVSWWNILCVLVFSVGVFFRFYLLSDVPLDMFSDQAEKLYDVMDVLDGNTPIFFVRNTGREAFQFYWTVLMIKLFGTGVSFLSLKIGTALAGVFVLPFVYKLGKRFGNRWVGLVAMLFCGTAYWPNVIGRVALRFAFYPMFTAPVLWFFFKGLAEHSRRDLIFAGIFLGLGLHGYSPFRIVPVLLVLIFVTYLFTLPKEFRGNALKAFGVLIFFAFVVFLPLGRAMVDMPDSVLYRALTRLGESETAFEKSPALIFADNFWKGLVMPFYDNGQTWVHSIIFRPALDHLTASFFFIGVVYAVLRFIRTRKWQTLWMVLMIPVLMLSSTLSLAFPRENPCLNRTGGAVIPIMILAAYGFCCSVESLLGWFKKRVMLFSTVAVLAFFVLVNVCGHNYELVFKEYRIEYAQNAWNTTQIGEVIRGFAESIGSYENAFVIPNPHWVDTRLVGINAGDPKRDYALDRSLIETLSPSMEPRLFIFRDSDVETQELLQSLYPNGLQKLHLGPYSNKNFFSYTVLGE